MSWGFHKGCSFTSSHCPTRSETCQNYKELGCSADHLAFSVCDKSRFSGNCLLKRELSHSLCIQGRSAQQQQRAGTYGANSRCFMLNSSKRSLPICLETKCLPSSVLKFYIRGVGYLCNRKGHRITTNIGVIECPEPKDVCGNRSVDCPNACSGHGKCRENGTCRCDYDFAGENCSRRRRCDNQTLVCESEGTHLNVIQRMNFHML